MLSRAEQGLDFLLHEQSANRGQRDWYLRVGEAFEQARLEQLPDSLLPFYNEFFQRIRAILSDIVRNSQLKHYTDHSVTHSKVNMGILAALTCTPAIQALNLSEVEFWGLLLGAYLHDHRMVTGVRIGHERLSAEELDGIPGLNSLLDGLGIPVEAIQHICELHSSKTKFDRPDVQPLRTNLLGALLRMADSLDYTADRLPTPEFLANKRLDRSSIIEFHKQECVRKILIEGNCVDIHAWMNFGNIHLIEQYLRKDYPDKYLSSLGVEFAYRFLSAEPFPETLRSYPCLDELVTHRVVGLEELEQVAADETFLEAPVLGGFTRPKDWTTFRESLVVPDLFGVQPRDYSQGLYKPGIHVITGAQGCGKSVFLLLVLEELCQPSSGTNFSAIKVLPRARLHESLPDILDGLDESVSQLLVVDGFHADGVVDHLRADYRLLLSAVAKPDSKLSVVLTVSESEWSVLEREPRQSLLHYNSRSPLGLRRLLGQALRWHNLQLDGVGSNEIDALGDSGNTDSTVLREFVDKIITAANGCARYVVALVEELRSANLDLTKAELPELPLGISQLLQKELVRALEIGQLHLMTSLSLLAQTDEGISLVALNHLVDLIGPEDTTSIDATRRFLTSCTEGDLRRRRLRREWSLAFRSWKPAPWEPLGQMKVRAEEILSDLIETLLQRADGREAADVFEDFIALKRYHAAYTLSQDERVPRVERRLLERRLRTAWVKAFGSDLFGLTLDPIKDPLLTRCLEALITETPRVDLIRELTGSPVAEHPLGLLFRAECGRLLSSSKGSSIVSGNENDTLKLYQDALSVGRGCDTSEDFLAFTKVQFGLFLYDVCKRCDQAIALWEEVKLFTEGRTSCRVRGLALHYLGRAAFHNSNWRDTSDYYSESWDNLERAGDCVLQSRLGTSMADAWTFLYDLDRAQETITFCLNVKRLLGDRMGEAMSLGVQGNLQARRGDYVDAIRNYEEDLQILHAYDIAGAEHVKTKLAEVCLKAGDVGKAERLLLEVETRLGGPEADPVSLAFCWKGLAKVRIVQGDLVDAAWRVERVLNVVTNPYVRAFFLRLAARLAAAGYSRPGWDVMHLLEQSRELFQGRSLATEVAVCEFYRPLLSDSPNLVPSCSAAKRSLWQLSNDVPNSKEFFQPWLEKLEAIENKDFTLAKRELQALVTFFEY